jgi:polysaccharide export outer membrane protein
MRNKIVAAICGVVFVFLTSYLQADETTQANFHLQQSIEEARRLCQQAIDPKASALAKQAGYDVDKLCASVRRAGSSSSAIATQLPAPVTPRKVEVGEKKQLKPSQQSAQDNSALRLFGYDLFAGDPTSYQPNAQIPIEPNYSLGPGDELRIQFYGKVNDYFEQTISRDGSISFPKIGPVGIAGLTFAEAKQLINRKVAEEYIGVKVSLSLGSLRSIRVFVLGEAYKPGTYTVPSLSTMTNVLFLSGGVTNIASLRNIQLKRDGEVRAVLDLYDLLLSGDRSKDFRLQAGDTIFIPTIKYTASIDGQVRRPAIYETAANPTVSQLIELAGGLLPTAFRDRATIRRVDDSGFMTALDIDLSTDTGLKTQIKNGDHLAVGVIADDQRQVVTLSGNLHHPGQFLWREGLKISDLISHVDELKPNTDMDFALLVRELLPTGKIITFYVNLSAVLADTDNPSNISLLPRDRLMVFSNQEDRIKELAPLLAKLQLQSRLGEMARIATIRGTVRSPGEYPLTKNMSLSQLIAAAGGLREQAYTQAVEVTSFDFSDGDQAVTSHRTIDLKTLVNNQKSDVILQPHDVVSVRTLPEYRETLSIELNGEVRLPGVYNFVQGETLSAVIERAGGLTDSAFAQAAVFTRESIRRQEIKRLEELSERMRADISAINLQGEKSVDVESEERILERLDQQKALGRLVIDLSAIIDGSVDDVVLRNGDRLTIPEYSQEVSVLGEVPWPSSYQYNSRLILADYVALAGGADVRADKDRIYVVKADGSVRIPNSSGWLRWQRFAIEPGDTVIVPMDVDRQRPMALWREASSIIYQLSLGAAAIGSF